MKFTLLIEKIIETIQHWQEVGLVNHGHFIHGAINSIDLFVADGEYTKPQETYVLRARAFFESLVENEDSFPTLEMVDESNALIDATAKLV